MSRSSWTKLVADREPAKAVARSTHSNMPPGTRLRPRAKRAVRFVEQVDCPQVQVYDLLVVGKPRQTHSDRWKKRDAVLRYRAMCDEMRLRGVQLPDAYVVVVYLPMPASWPAAMKATMNGTRHQVKPDHDNLAKSVGDATRRQDQRIHDGRALKRWAYAPRLVVLNMDKRGQPTPEEILDWLPSGPGAIA